VSGVRRGRRICSAPGSTLIIDTSHELVKLAQAIDWRFLESCFGEVYSDGPGMPPLPTRLMAGLAIMSIETHAIAF
jgi:hypothetical protein